MEFAEIAWQTGILSTLHYLCAIGGFLSTTVYTQKTDVLDLLQAKSTFKFSLK